MTREEAARRLEAAILRLEMLLEQYKAEPHGEVDPTALAAAEKYIERRKFEIQGVQAFDE